MSDIKDLHDMLKEPEETISLEEFTKLLAEAKKNKSSMSVIVDGKKINISGIEDGEDSDFAILPSLRNDTTMKVSDVDEEEYVAFDNGVKISPDHIPDCCETNYLDFSQFKVGMEFPAINEPQDIQKLIHLRKDGLYLVSEDGLPIWAQARSSQNGYYSRSVGVKITMETPFCIVVGDDPEPMEGEIYE